MFRIGKIEHYIKEVVRLKFIDNMHKQFFEKKMEELSKLGKTDVYYKALTYTLSICETTREHFEEIFDTRKSKVNLDSLQTPWQTGTSTKVTRMALNLWNHNLMYDSEEDLRNERISDYYAPSEIFCCSYAPYFYEGIKIRYPEYTNCTENNSDINYYSYMRVGNKEKLNRENEEEICD